MANHYLGYTAAQLDEAIRKVLSGELNVPLQEKTVTPSTSKQTVTPDSEYKGLSQVTVNAIPQSYTNEIYNQGYEDGYNAEKPYLCELEYIQSSGTQYIDTGFKPNQDTRVVMSVEFAPSTSNNFLFGALTTNVGRFAFANYSNGSYRVHYYSGYTEATSSAKYTDKFKLDMNKNTTAFNDGEYTCSTTYNSFQCGHSLWLFDFNSNGSSGGASTAKLYSCQIYDNGTLIRDYIPVLDKQCTPCLYDKVNGVFYYNAGTGQFTCPERPFLSRLSYIQSSGTQYINTGINYDSSNYNKLRFVIKNLYPSLSATYWLVNGCSGSGIFYIGLNNADGTIWYGNGVNSGTSKKATAGVVNDWDYNAIAGTLKFNGETLSTGISFSAPSSPLPLTLFGYSTTTSNVDKHTERLYSCQIYNNDTLIRDYIPVLDCNGVPCLFDKVNETFTYNAGTGTFQY